SIPRLGATRDHATGGIPSAGAKRRSEEPHDPTGGIPSAGAKRRSEEPHDPTGGIPSAGAKRRSEEPHDPTGGLPSAGAKRRSEEPHDPTGGIPRAGAKRRSEEPHDPTGGIPSAGAKRRSEEPHDPTGGIPSAGAKRRSEEPRMKRRVVVTGMGAITPVGNDVATTWAAIKAGVSGGADITKFDHSTFPVHFACEVKGFDPLMYLERKEAKRADLFAQYAIAASAQAMTDAGFDDPSQFDPERLGVIIGSGIGGLKTFEEQHDVYRERGQSKISAFFIPMFISHIAAGLVSMRFNAKGPNYATISACATSAHAIGDAFRTIQYGDADAVITGGSEATVTPMAIGGFANMKALSERNESPATASRPFDATRD